MPTPQVFTYHCICTELVIATFTPLENFPKRKGDGARICRLSKKSEVPVPSAVVLSGSTIESHEPTVLKLEDGFEKRYFVQCQRCDLKIGYWLDKSQFDETESGMRADVVYLMPGGLMSTDEMKEGRDMGGQAELAAESGG